MQVNGLSYVQYCLLTCAALDLQAAGQKGHIQSVRRLHLGATGIRVSSRKKGNGKQRTGKEPEQGGEASTSQMVLRPRAGKGSGTKA